jgi:hypothetical protein
MAQTGTGRVRELGFRAGLAEADPLLLYFIEPYRFVDRYAIQPKAIWL